MTLPDHRPRIALIHALADSVAPAHAAFAEIWPEAWIFDLLDTSLSADRAAAAGAEDDVMARCVRLADYAEDAQGHFGRTQAILFTCSAFGPGIEAAARRSIPVLKPNEAAFVEALSLGADIGLVATFAPSLIPLERELRTLAAARGLPLRLTPILADGALAALQRGDSATHHRLIAEAAKALGHRDAILLGQFSMAAARPMVEEHAASAIITTPSSAVEALKRRLTDISSTRTPSIG
jgi:Asp/Glu/hydantoin racemase